MVKATKFSWYDEPCKKCKSTDWLIAKYINQGGTPTYRYVCVFCGYRSFNFIRAKVIKELGIKVDEIEPIHPRHKCEVCGDEGAENHHWAPTFLFGIEADKWPQSYLCPRCHKKWHDLVTPNMSKAVEKP